MSDRRTVEFGCGTWVMLGLILSALWTIGAALGQIGGALKMANCLTESAQGLTCPDAKR